MNKIKNSCSNIIKTEEYKKTWSRMAEIFKAECQDLRRKILLSFRILAAIRKDLKTFVSMMS